MRLKGFSDLLRGWSKIHHWKIFPRAKVASFSKELPNDVSCIAPHLLSQCTIEEYVLHRLHNWGATIGATLVNLYQDMFTSFVDCHYLMNDCHLLLCLVFMPNDTPIQRGGGRNFVPPFVKDWFFKSLLSSDPLPLKVAPNMPRRE